MAQRLADAYREAEAATNTATDGLVEMYDLGELRESEDARFTQILDELGAQPSVLLADVQREIARLTAEALRRFAEEYPDAPRKRQRIPA